MALYGPYKDAGSLIRSGDDSKRKEVNRRMLLPPLRPSLQRRGNDGRHEMARLQLQKTKTTTRDPRLTMSRMTEGRRKRHEMARLQMQKQKLWIPDRVGDDRQKLTARFIAST